jgi:hypothetical protein
MIPTVPVEVTGIWLLRVTGQGIVVRAEIDGRWVDVISERFDGEFSHIVEPGGMLTAVKRAGHDHV